MLTKAKIKLIRSLEQKKYRELHRLFVAEGDKTVREILDSPLTVECVSAKASWLRQIPGRLLEKAGEIIETDNRELAQISFLKTPNQAMVLVRIPEHPLDLTEITAGLSLYLDGVQDPGNMGTIIRTADRFGIRHIVCGEGCADPFGPKTVQSTMGALIRVKTYRAGTSFFRQPEIARPDFPVYGMSLDGDNIYDTPLTPKAVIVAGNESKGISADVAQYITRKLLIPSYPPGEATSESLNVAVATAIVCAEFRRREAPPLPSRNV